MVEWILTNGRTAAERPEIGLYDSALGAGYVLRRAGYPDQAKWFVDWALSQDRSRVDLSIFGGQAGISLAAAELARGPEPLVALSGAEEIGSELARRGHALRPRLQSGGPGPEPTYGLLHGIAGTALALHRFGRLTGNPAVVDDARALLEHELTGYVRCKDGSQMGWVKRWPGIGLGQVSGANLTTSDGTGAFSWSAAVMVIVGRVEPARVGWSHPMYEPLRRPHARG